MNRAFALIPLAGLAIAGACGKEDTDPPPRAAEVVSSSSSTTSSSSGGGGEAAGGHGGAGGAGGGTGGSGGTGGDPLAPSCSDGMKNGGESDLDCGGNCSPCRAGLTCLLDADCYSRQCEASTCAPASCANGVQDGDETDADCGGGTAHHGDNPSCPPCSDLLGCHVREDCRSMSCVSETCLPPSCTDGASNGTETGVDCGGICNGCAPGSPCAGPRDCVSGVCESAVCLPANCTDGVRNGTETDLDCGGMCSSKCPAGQRCNANADCSTSLCNTTTHLCTCPPLMVIAPVSGGGSYCIDAYEVTKLEYDVFLGANPVLPSLPPACAGNNYRPSSDWPYTEGRVPVNYVDWCDAYAYCAYSGKHLCGRIGGGSNPPDAWADELQSEWFNACTGQGVNEYPYGHSYSDICVGGDPAEPFYIRVLPPMPPFFPAATCEGGVSDLFNMSGNVAEWEDSCEPVVVRPGEPPVESCRIRGGSRASAIPTPTDGNAGNDRELQCDVDAPLKPRRDNTDPNVGFRCCL